MRIASNPCFFHLLQHTGIKETSISASRHRLSSPPSTRSCPNGSRKEKRAKERARKRGQARAFSFGKAASVLEKLRVCCRKPVATSWWPEIRFGTRGRRRPEAHVRTPAWTIKPRNGPIPAQPRRASAARPAAGSCPRPFCPRARSWASVGARGRQEKSPGRGLQG